LEAVAAPVMLLLFPIAIFAFPPHGLLSNDIDYPEIDIPQSYNFLSEFPKCSVPPSTFPILSALGHRFCRFLDQPISLSPQYIIACDPTFISYSPRSLFVFLEQRGVTTLECHPPQNVTRYTSDFCGQCANGGLPDYFRSKIGTLRQLSTTKEIEKEIYIYGPLTGVVDGEEKEIVGWKWDSGRLIWIVLDDDGNGVEMGTVAHRGDDVVPGSYFYAADPEID
jgi:hypothetical protein